MIVNALRETPDEPSFDRAVAELTATFVGLPTEAIDAHIVETIGRVADLLGLDRVHVAQRVPETDRLEVTHHWNRPGWPAVPSMSEEDVPWLVPRLARGEAVAIATAADWPPEAVKERERMALYAERSVLALPLATATELIGGLGFATLRSECSWPAPLVERLRLVGKIVANALARKRAEEALKRALADNERLRRQLEAENVYLREEVEEAGEYGEIIGQSAALRAALHKTDQVADTDTPVLLLGETGTGKELVARAIHARSRRRDRALITVNCAALPATLVENELFGHEKGAFTGAGTPQPGRFELADGGTLFLDEVGEMDPSVQAKLLRVLQDGEVQRLGSTRSRKVDVRIVAATNRDLQRAIEEGRFRADLYYRLSVFPVELPSLRERREDIPLLVWYFVQSRQRELGRTIERIARSDMEALCAYSWPGNVRELQNVVDRALILSRGSVLRVAEALGKAPSRAVPAPRDGDTMRAAEQSHIREVLERCRWTIEGQGQAAERLGLKPSTLRNRMKKLGLARPR